MIRPLDSLDDLKTMSSSDMSGRKKLETSAHLVHDCGVQGLAFALLPIGDGHVVIPKDELICQSVDCVLAVGFAAPA